MKNTVSTSPLRDFSNVPTRKDHPLVSYRHSHKWEFVDSGFFFLFLYFVFLFFFACVCLIAHITRRQAILLTVGRTNSMHFMIRPKCTAFRFPLDNQGTKHAPDRDIKWHFSFFFFLFVSPFWRNTPARASCFRPDYIFHESDVFTLSADDLMAISFSHASLSFSTYAQAFVENSCMQKRIRISVTYSIKVQGRFSVHFSIYFFLKRRSLSDGRKWKLLNNLNGRLYKTCSTKSGPVVIRGMDDAHSKQNPWN